MRLNVAIVVGFFALLLSAPATAQTATTPSAVKGDIALGVRHLNDPSDEYVFGAVFGAGVRLGPYVALVGEADVHRNTTVSSPTTSILTEQHVYAGGVRVYSPVRRVRAFAHLLAGHVVTTRTVSSLPSASGTVSKFTWQPGAGLDVQIAHRVAARVQGDIREWGARPHLDYYKVLRLTGSVVFLFGGRD